MELTNLLSYTNLGFGVEETEKEVPKLHRQCLRGGKLTKRNIEFDLVWACLVELQSLIPTMNSIPLIKIEAVRRKR